MNSKKTRPYRNLILYTPADAATRVDVGAADIREKRHVDSMPEGMAQTLAEPIRAPLRVWLLDHRLHPAVGATLLAMVSRIPAGGVEQRYVELLAHMREGTVLSQEEAEEQLRTEDLPEKVQDFLDTWVQKYAHGSISELVGVSIIVEGISWPLARLLMDNPLFRGIEASTRALDHLGTRRGWDLCNPALEALSEDPREWRAHRDAQYAAWGAEVERWRVTFSDRPTAEAVGVGGTGFKAHLDYGRWAMPGDWATVVGMVYDPRVLSRHLWDMRSILDPSWGDCPDNWVNPYGRRVIVAAHTALAELWEAYTKAMADDFHETRTMPGPAPAEYRKKQWYAYKRGRYMACAEEARRLAMRQTRIRRSAVVRLLQEVARDAFRGLVPRERPPIREGAFAPFVVPGTHRPVVGPHRQIDSDALHCTTVPFDTSPAARVAVDHITPSARFPEPTLGATRRGYGPSTERFIAVHGHLYCTLADARDWLRHRPIAWSMSLVLQDGLPTYDSSVRAGVHLDTSPPKLVEGKTDATSILDIISANTHPVHVTYLSPDPCVRVRQPDGADERWSSDGIDYATLSWLHLLPMGTRVRLDFHGTWRDVRYAAELRAYSLGAHYAYQNQAMQLLCALHTAETRGMRVGRKSRKNTAAEMRPPTPAWEDANQRITQDEARRARVPGPEYGPDHLDVRELRVPLTPRALGRDK